MIDFEGPIMLKQIKAKWPNYSKELEMWCVQTSDFWVGNPVSVKQYTNNNLLPFVK